MDASALTLAAASQLLARGEISSVELTQGVLARINQLNPRLNAYITVDEEGALNAARQADERLRQGRGTPLTGLPIALKDIFCTRHLKTTCGSRMLANFHPPYDATVTQRLQQAGAVILGKTNMDEFAMGSSNETSWFGPVLNPWDESRTPGGSSGGSAAAVAADLCLAAVGTDTGGSIRQPASLCGITGLKPTYGRVSRYGMIAFASSLDQAGPMTKSVEDAALLLQVMAGHDAADATSIPQEVPDYLAGLAGGVKGMRLGIPQEYFSGGMQPEVQRAVEEAIGLYKELGVIIQPVSLPHTDFAVPVYYIIASAEASSNLARYDGVRFSHRCEGAKDLADMYFRTRAEGFGAEVKRRIMLGTYVLSSGYYDAYYRKAQKVRRLIANDFDAAFAQVDAVITPTSPTTAFRIGERTEDPVQMYLSDIFTIGVNLAGLPGLSMPCGVDEQGLPIGVQLIGPPLGEARLLQLGHAYQQASDWHLRKPALV